MKKGGDEVKAKGTATATSSSSVSSVEARITSADFVDERVGIEVGEMSMGDGGVVPSQGAAAAAAASAVNFKQSVRVGAGEMIDVEQILQVNRRFTVSAPGLQSQTGRFLLENSFNHGGSGLNSPFPAANNSPVPEPMNNSHAFSYVPHDNVRFPSAVIPTLRRKADDFGNPYNFENFPLRRDSLYPHVTGRFCHDSVFQSSSVPVAPLHQHPLYPVAGRQSNINYYMAEPPKCEMIKNQEMNIFSASCDLRIGSSSSTTFPTRKRKLGNNALEPAAISKQSSSSPSSVQHAGHHKLENSEDDKEAEERGLMMVLQKELRNSDVGSLGRIVLPKKAAEANLPPLHERDGVYLYMEDMVSPVIWEFKFRYWPNNKSRMYVMEHTGDFVRTHELQTGDFFIIYKEEASGKFMVGGRKCSRSSVTADQEERNYSDRDKEEGGSTQQRRSKRGMEANHQQSLDYERDSGGSTQFTPPLPDLDPDVIPFDRYLP